MTEQPETHWGVISQHTWTLEFGESSTKGGDGSGAPAVSSFPKEGKRSRNPCWRFNKGRCTFGESCEYDHRCSHCGKRGHGKHECFKRNRGEKSQVMKKEKTSKY